MTLRLVIEMFCVVQTYIPNVHLSTHARDLPLYGSNASITGSPFKGNIVNVRLTAACFDLYDPIVINSTSKDAAKE